MARYLYRPGHPLANERGFVEASQADLEDPSLALNAPILSGRFYEDAPPATDGTPINSRARHREYMRVNGLAMESDYREHRQQKAKERESLFTDGGDHKARREAVARAAYEVEKRSHR